MGRAGTIKKDKATRELENDPRAKYEQPKNAPTPTADNLAAPPHLGGAALAKWVELREVLEPAGLMTDADKDSLAQYCVNWQLYLQCIEAINKHGMVLEFTASSGKDYSQVSPHTTTMLKLHTAMVKAAKEFGLTPYARSSMDVGEPKEVDLIDQFKPPERKG